VEWVVDQGCCSVVRDHNISLLVRLRGVVANLGVG